MTIYEKLSAVQSELKAPKGQYNSYGKYKYRSCEDVLEALKPLLKKYGAAIVICDKIRLVGDWHYIEATAAFVDITDGTRLENTAFARECAEKKGMDASQITGTASTYARKYALNGLFLIDDAKDMDADELHRQTDSEQQKPAQLPELVGTVEIETIKKIVKALGGKSTKDFLEITGVRVSELPKLEKSRWGEIMVDLNAKMTEAEHAAAIREVEA